MGKGFKRFAALSALGGLAYGGFKLKQQLDYVKEVYNDVILFKGERLVYDEVFEGDSVAAINSGLEIDMSEMTMEVDEVNLDVYGFCSGIKIVVPEGIHVVHNGSNKYSGVSVNVAEYENDDILTLNINYDVTCSGLLIETKYDDYEEILDESDDEAEETETQNNME